MEGKSENGLYPIWLPRGSLKCNQASFTTFLGVKASSLGWHIRLGHSSIDVISHVLNQFQLPVSCSNFNKEVVCISCQMVKAMGQPFSASNRVSTQPIELIHIDVWTSPILSISGCKY